AGGGCAGNIVCRVPPLPPLFPRCITTTVRTTTLSRAPETDNAMQRKTCPRSNRPIEQKQNMPSRAGMMAENTCLAKIKPKTAWSSISSSSQPLPPPPPSKSDGKKKKRT
ncbi:unnamed protein product, partial [Ectocarpus sp. 6 AP-2014]